MPESRTPAPLSRDHSRAAAPQAQRKPREAFVKPVVEDLGGLTLITLGSVGGEG
jgi:hypothetical protein